MFAPGRRNLLRGHPARHGCHRARRRRARELGCLPPPPNPHAARPPHLRQALGRQGTFWSDRYHAIPILDEASLLEKMMYVLMNPVAAGLAATCAEYPDSRALGEPRSVLLVGPLAAPLRSV